MKKEIHRSFGRGKTLTSWLHSKHSFTFNEYINPNRMGFGKLRVLNDDHVGPGAGFDTHHHENMEIISIVLSGSLQHKDSRGNSEMIDAGEVQVMSAGTGVDHSESNFSKAKPVKFLQIWIEPKEKGTKPTYQQKKFSSSDMNNKFRLIVSGERSEDCLFINQNAYLSLAKIEKGKALAYDFKRQINGAFIFVISGRIDIDKIKLEERDAVGITDAKSVSLYAFADSEVLVIEVPVKD